MTVDWGDGAQASGRITTNTTTTFEHVYTEAGEYEVTLTAEGEVGSEPCSNPGTATITVTVLPDYTTRLSGTERLATSHAISQDLWNDDEAQSVTLARAEQFPDALAGAPLAVAKEGPLLLTYADELAPGTEAELLRVLPESGTVYLLGGASALSADIESDVADLGYETVRLGGETRLETAAQIADEIAADPETIFLTWGFDFPDALVAGAVAGDLGGVVLLTQEGGPGDATATYLEDHPDAELVAIGGVARDAVPDAEAIVGVNRFDTSAKVAATYYPDATSFAIASGGTFPDALGGGAHAGALGIPLLLSGQALLPDEVAAYLDADGREYDPGYLYGGTVALSQEVAVVASIFIVEP